MRRLRLSGGSAAVLLAISAGSVWAQDQLTMPFACSVRDGRVVLTPSAEQTYAIAGARHQQLFTACHPQNPAVCRTFPVHNFSIACGRTPVRWIDVVSAASDQQAGRVFVDNGQLNMAVGRARLGPGRLCDENAPRPFRWGPGYRARQDRECDDGRPDGRDRNLVVLPPGYAPLGLAEAYFVPAPNVPAPKMVSREEIQARPHDPPPHTQSTQRVGTGLACAAARCRETSASFAASGNRHEYGSGVAAIHHCRRPPERGARQS